ncbi:hypothetical protein JL722_11743 [Aureococcus anophagefferens]|nr:hypothetical protein JL722_11743 [Aureococcus anophagefferens]
MLPNCRELGVIESRWWAAPRRRRSAMAEMARVQDATIFAVNKDEETALHVAARAGSAEGVRLLLAHGAVADARDGRGRTALHSRRAAACLLDALRPRVRRPYWYNATTDASQWHAPGEDPPDDYAYDAGAYARDGADAAAPAADVSALISDDSDDGGDGADEELPPWARDEPRRGRLRRAPLAGTRASTRRRRTGAEKLRAAAQNGRAEEPRAAAQNGRAESPGGGRREPGTRAERGPALRVAGRARARARALTPPSAARPAPHDLVPLAPELPAAASRDDDTFELSTDDDEDSSPSRRSPGAAEPEPDAEPDAEAELSPAATTSSTSGPPRRPARRRGPGAAGARPGPAASPRRRRRRPRRTRAWPGSDAGGDLESEPTRSRSSSATWPSGTASS